SVRFIGSGDAFGSGGRFQTCILLEGNTESALIDCGASSLVALKASGINPSTMGSILITHLHGDHFGGIPFFILDAQFAKRTQPLIIAGRRTSGRVSARLWKCSFRNHPKRSSAFQSSSSNCAPRSQYLFAIVR